MSTSSDHVEHRSRGVEGPSATSGGWRHFWDLLILSSTMAFRRQYVDTIFGFVWMFLSPLLLFTVIYLFVTEIVKRFADVPHYGLLLLLNVVLFGFFRSATSQAMRSLIGSAGLVRKMSVPRAVLPLSAVAATFYALLANLVVVMVAMPFGGVDPRSTWLLLPVIIAALVLITSGMSLLLAGIYVRFRDIGQVWPTVSQALFYISPIIWPLELLPEKIMSDLQTFNPLAPVLVEARVWIIDPGAPGWFEARSGLEAFGPFLVLALIWVAALVVFSREARRAAEDF